MLTACVLVKNEEDKINLCLENIKGKVDELIIADNGSSDKTVEIAQKYDCRIIKIETSEMDESLWRNTYLDNVTTEWVIVLDADEIIDSKGWINIHKIISSAPFNVKAFRLPCFNYTGQGKWAAFTKTRLFRTDARIRYDKRRIHPSPLPSIKAIGGNVSDIYAPIHHLDVFFPSRSDLKRKRYIEVTQQEIERCRNEPFVYQLYNYLGLEFGAQGDYEKAEYYYKQSLKITNALNNPFAILYMAQNYYLKGDFDSAMKNAKKLLKLNSDPKGRALTLLAEINISEENFKQAITLCEEALNFEKLAPQNYLNLASLYSNGCPEKTIEYIRYAIDLNPFLLEKGIYEVGSTNNTYRQQISLLSTTDRLFDYIKNNLILNIHSGI